MSHLVIRPLVAGEEDLAQAAPRVEAEDPVMQLGEHLLAIGRKS